MPPSNYFAVLIRSIDSADRWELEGVARVLTVEGITEAERQQLLDAVRHIAARSDSPPAVDLPEVEVDPGTTTAERPGPPTRFGYYLLRLIREAGYENIRAFAKAAGVERVSVTACIMAKPVLVSARDLRRMARALRVPVENLAIMLISER